ncbi:MAG: hypothetical protein CL583_12340 [Alteromonadaceae bacterium]|nr:hypothetical protein [Alteromonadaceae bacterium]
MTKKARQPFANLYFFPLAAAYAALVLPWSVLAQFELVVAPPGIQAPLGHAHEMIFGFALAVVAGYVLGPQPKPRIFLLTAIWLTARIAFLGWPSSMVSLALNIGFAVLLAYRVVPRFARTAKKWRNKAVAPIILGLCAGAVVFHGLYRAEIAGPLYGILLEAILLLSTLMFFMGGRMLAPAVAGHLLKQGHELEARVQPRLEGTVLIVMGLVLVLNLLPWAPWRQMTGLLLLLAAALTLFRLVRWPVRLCLDRPDLLALMLGYWWIIAGWVLIATALLSNAIPLSTALHGMTIGALGTLTLTVMARTRTQRSHKHTDMPKAVYVAIALISFAALARIAAAVVPGLSLYLLGAFSWSLAFLILTVVLIQLAQAEKRRRSLL